MYYYITEPPKTKEARRELDQLRTMLASLGIAGEFVSTESGRTVEKLAELGVAKKYSTLVAIGSEGLINQLAILLAGTDYIFGAVPLYQPDLLADVNNTHNLTEALIALKYRRIKLASLGKIEPNKYFLTRTNLSLNDFGVLNLKFARANVKATFSDIEILGRGGLIIKKRDLAKNFLQRMWQKLNQFKQPIVNYSYFNVAQFSLETGANHSVYLDQQIIAKTPIAFKVIPSCLKMIMKRNKIVTDE